jgi:hypothetical protein
MHYLYQYHKNTSISLNVSVQRGFSSEALNAYLLVFYDSCKPIPIMCVVILTLFVLGLVTASLEKPP